MSLSVGYLGGCVVAGGANYRWGDGSNGVLGDGSNTSRAFSVKADILSVTHCLSLARQLGTAYCSLRR